MQGIHPVVRIRKLYTPDPDRNYWLSRTPSDRLKQLEAIRCEYHQWRYGGEPGFQRVYSIIKR